MTIPTSLEPLDFTPAPTACDADTEPARWRAVSTCGCANLVCDDHADALRRMARLVAERRAAMLCAHCNAEGVTLDILERISE